MNRCIFFMLWCLLVVAIAKGQTGIGTKSPKSAGILELISSNKGMLIPRVQLTGTNDNVTIAVGSGDEGLLVFNLQDAGAGATAVKKERFYIWKGNVWEGIGSLSFARNLIDTYNIASVGFVGKPNTYAWKALGTTNYTAWETINFANEIIDQHGMHNAGTSTADAAGLYNFYGNITVERSTAAGNNKMFGGQIRLQKAGETTWTVVSTSYFGTGAGGEEGSVPIYWAGKMNVNDKLQVQFRLADSEDSGNYRLVINVTNFYVVEYFKRL